MTVKSDAAARQLAWFTAGTAAILCYVVLALRDVSLWLLWPLIFVNVLALGRLWPRD